MKPIGHKDRQVDISGVAETKKMTLRADARMIRNILNDIYSEKEKTVVRELMANGFDSHIKAGCPEREIEVHLPTALEPNLIVRDYGTGMDHRFMMEMYSDIGFSNKRDSNQETGMHGVGSKSPISITDTFVVKAYDDDGIRQYMVVIPDDEHPEINFTFQIYEQGVKYERGIEVIVPIDASRRQAVLDGLASQHFCWFDKPVKFLGALDEIKHKFYTAIAKINDGLYLATPAIVGNGRGPQWNVFVRQGAAVYPLVEGQINNYVSQKHISLIKHLCQNGRHVLIDLPLGTANVTLAREAIQYDTVSAKNVGKVLNKCFSHFNAVLDHTVGDARDYRVATERVGEKFFLNKKDRNKLMSQKLACMLVVMCSDTLEKNYKEWHAKLPDVPEMVQDLSIVTGVVMKPTGKMIRPPYASPKHLSEMYMRDFPEGKVILHKGMLHVSAREELVANIDGSEARLNFMWPNVVFVIPSHLKEWKQRIQDYCKLTFKDEVLSNDANLGIPIQVIRCALRNVDPVKDALLKHSVQAVPVTIDVLPGIPVAKQKKRNFSKTSVYPWNQHGWSEIKMEPDYSEPAYYMARIGIGKDMWLEPPTGPVNGPLRRRRKASSNDTATMVREGRLLKYIDETTPIYRVTENQAKRIAEECPKWVHFPSWMFLAIEKNVHVNTKLSLGKSNIGVAYDNFLTRLINYAKSANVGNDERDIETFKFLRWLSAEDPIFEIIAACRYAISQQASVFRGNDSESRLEEALYEHGERTDKKAIAKYDKLHAVFEAKYYYMMKLADDHRSISWIPHARMYLDNAFKAWQSEPAKVNLTDFAELDSIVADFRTKMAEIGLVVDKRELGLVKLRSLWRDEDHVRAAAG